MFFCPLLRRFFSFLVSNQCNNALWARCVQPSLSSLLREQNSTHSLDMVIALPLTTSFPSLASTVPSNGPCVESYFIMYTYGHVNVHHDGTTI